MSGALTLATESRIITIDQRCLIVWIDETGHEEFADPGFPVFGLGGVAVPAADYETVLAIPWRTIKRDSFGNESISLHAAGLRPNNAQMNSFTSFFNFQRFARLAAVTRKEADKPLSVTTMQLMATLLRDWIIQLSNDVFKPIHDIVLVFEECQRLSEQVLANFSHWRVQVNGQEKPVEIFRATKDILEPGMEVADFVVHTAGAQARADTWPAQRRDFQTIFQPTGLAQEWVKFRQITESKLN
jgi:hypothetical protein